MSDLILSVEALGFVWWTADPFLFCVHHDDAYPAGDADMAPAASLEGRSLGSDFEGKDGWRMYHGATVPGFPQHPHRGFETVTLVRKGLADHADSLGATGRFGGGDAQWMTAGGGVVHSEMFPLVRRDADNPLELFQIWLNLPRASKMVPPHYKMLWSEQIPTVRQEDGAGRGATVTVVAGRLGEAVPPGPPPHSWAAAESNHVAIWAIALEPGAAWVTHPAPEGVNRTLYVFEGDVSIAGQSIATDHGVRVRPDAAIPCIAGAGGAQLLMLQGRPIGEPVVQYGPFVMNTRAEIQQAYHDYQRTQFGGWPWDRNDPVHPRDEGRFARHADGRVERPT